MPNEFSPDLTKLDGDYQVLTELHGEGDSRVFLARHLRLNRDVTISVFRVTSVVSAETLAQFASDAQQLTEARHPHIVPVIDGIWLDDRTFAAVRARVRGATLDQSLGATGPMSIGRVAAAVADIVEALSWARTTGIAQREIAPWDVVFQQGSGRLLIAFEPAKNAALTRSECDDARTVRRLAVEMLAGEIDRDVEADDIAVPRGIPADVADALAALRYCTVRNASSAIAALSSALDANATRNPPAERQTALSVAPPLLNGPVVETHAEREIPTSVERSADSVRSIPVVTSIPHRRKAIPVQRDDAVVVMKPGFGFNARLATAIAALAAVGVIGVVALNHKETPPTVSAVVPTDTTSNAAGEVALHPVAPQPAPIVSATIDSARVKPRPIAPRAATTSDDSSSNVRRRAISTDSAATPKKRVVLDSAEEAERQFQRDSAADVADPCLSTESSSQRKCLLESIDRNDRELNRVYGRLIAALRRQVGAASADPDPETVNDLRAEQRKWVDTRDTECRDVGEEPLYAKSRAACFAQKSADRARELQRRLDGIPPN
jgi:uncharacterized protein YecT (DUF1311 family)